MEVQKEAFNNLIELYKKLPIDLKRKEILNEVEEMILNYSKICTKLDVMPDMMLNKEMLNINKKDLSEDEFLQALYAYLNTLEDISAQFIEKMNDEIYKKG